MTTSDYERPFVSAESMPFYKTLDAVVSSRYGLTVRATKLSNIEYKIRFDRLSQTNNMKPPPSRGVRCDGGSACLSLSCLDDGSSFLQRR